MVELLDRDRLSFSGECVLRDRGEEVTPTHRTFHSPCPCACLPLCPSLFPDFLAQIRLSPPRQTERWLAQLLKIQLHSPAACTPGNPEGGLGVWSHPQLHSMFETSLDPVSRKAKTLGRGRRAALGEAGAVTRLLVALPEDLSLVSSAHSW